MGRRDTRAAILAAALQVAVRSGITGASMDQIAETAGVAKGSLYYNFNSKDAIFEELIRDGLGELATALATAAQRSEDGRTQLRALIPVTLERLRARPELARLLVSELFRVDRPWSPMLGILRQKAIGAFADAIGRIVAQRGQAIENLEPVAAGMFGSALVAGVDWLMFFPTMPTEKVVQALLDLSALGGPPQAPQSAPPTPQAG